MENMIPPRYPVNWQNPATKTCLSNDRKVDMILSGECLMMVAFYEICKTWTQPTSLKTQWAQSLPSKMLIVDFITVISLVDGLLSVAEP